MKITKYLLGVTASVMLSSMASAATLDFGTSGGSNCGTSGCSFGGVYSVAVSGSDSVTQALYGLGVDSAGTDDGALDNYATGQSREYLTFTFNTATMLDSINLGLFESGAEGGNSYYTIDGGSEVSMNSSSISVGQVVNTLVISTDPRPTGFIAIGNTTFRVNQLNVSPVPLPAAAWLFGSALMGMVGIARRRKVTA